MAHWACARTWGQVPSINTKAKCGGSSLKSRHWRQEDPGRSLAKLAQAKQKIPGSLRDIVSRHNKGSREMV